ncbi:MAG: Mrp/NBP35 family ATP-binding protein [Bacteroidales bacterium]|nr:Mrp/NBP35 family ATP-binding protein [Bacteroidales bacterium]
MSWFTPANHPDEHYFLFGRGGGMKLAREFDTRLLCQIPMVMEVGEAADTGRDVFQQSDKTAIEAFETLAGQVIEAVAVNSERRN